MTELKESSLRESPQDYHLRERALDEAVRRSLKSHVMTNALWHWRYWHSYLSKVHRLGLDYPPIVRTIRTEFRRMLREMEEAS